MEAERAIVALVIDYVRRKGGRVLNTNYTLVPPYMQFGEGDVLCEFDDVIFAIECKFMGQRKGKTARTRRNKHRKKILEQVLLHAAFAKLRFPDRSVRGAIITDEESQLVCNNMGIEVASRIVMARLLDVDSGLVPACSVASMLHLFSSMPQRVLDDLTTAPTAPAAQLTR